MFVEALCKFLKLYANAVILLNTDLSEVRDDT